MAEVKKQQASQAEIDEALDLLRRTKEQRAKQREKAKNNPEIAAKAKAQAARRRIREQLLIKKAVAAGITVTPAELDKAVADSKKQK